MSGKESVEQRLWKNPLRAALLWLSAAGLFLFVFSFMIARSAGSSRLMAYAGSAIHFLAAMAAAGYLARQGREKPMLAGLISGLTLCLLLLLAGFLLNAQEMSKDAMLSLISFTLAGALFGSFLFSGSRGRVKSRRVARKRRA